MIRTQNGAVGGASGLDPAEYGEIHSVASTPVFKSRPDLLPAEEALSLPPLDLPDPKIGVLNRALGKALTVDNPVWSGDPVPHLRALQKLLIADSLSRPQQERGVALGAIKVVEQAVRLRLRWQQMRRSATEADTDTSADAAQAAAQGGQGAAGAAPRLAGQHQSAPAAGHAARQQAANEQEDDDATQATAGAAG